MAKSFAELRRTRTQTAQDLADKLKDDNNQSGPKDDTSYWKLTLDKSGAGHALIRFLPAPVGEDFPYVKMIHHGFRGSSGEYYIENSRRTIGESDPVAIYNGALWKTNREADRVKVKAQAQRTTYIANIYVISDPENRAAEGKVFKFKFGKQIFGKIEDMLTEIMGKVNVFDMWGGANFLLRAYGELTQDRVMPKYDRSAFQGKSSLFETEEDPRYEEVWKGCYPLAPLVMPDKFKSFEELHARLEKAEGRPIALNGKTASTAEANDPSPPVQQSNRPAPAPTHVEAVDDSIPFDTGKAQPSTTEPGAEFDEAYFANLQAQYSK